MRCFSIHTQAFFLFISGIWGSIVYRITCSLSSVMADLNAELSRRGFLQSSSLSVSGTFGQVFIIQLDTQVMEYEFLSASLPSVDSACISLDHAEYRCCTLESRGPDLSCLVSHS